ncbi:hypothetical protein RJ639_000752 [Escallonia herrerae]|uniref:Calmodulin-binding domain-containing protein n=1 Tax=Escallonia herrerae TaxID=1293975 RepID=A0AA88XDS6_9ASTE|nr:hypothetical protein RJ639_000752 [Escallonia herrerae]
MATTAAKYEPKNGCTRRISTGNLNIQVIGEKVLPNYLRASSGSCHDYCKFGIKHVSETKARHPFPKRLSAIPDKIQDPARSENLAPTEKKLAVTPKTSRQFRSQTSHKPEFTTAEASTKNAAVPSKASPISTARHLSRRYSEIVIPKDLGALEIISKGGSSSEVKVGKDTKSSRMSKKHGLLPETSSPSPKPSMKSVLSTKTQNYDSKKASSVKNQNIIKRAESKQPSVDKVPEKTLYAIKPKAEDQNGVQTSSSPQLSSPTSLLSECMQSDISGLMSENNGNKIDNSTVEHKSRLTGVRKAGLGGDCSPGKLKFRRGKVVNVQFENSSPRRLKFKQRKVLDENLNGKADTRGRSLRKVVVNGELSGAKTKSMEVVLKHQDAEGKKDAQSLFNNVIEETASKLVQTRKSKVKALVGAFETVISLQDTKTSEIVTTC